MTNAEKYKEVFGIDVDPVACPTSRCKDCPCYEDTMFDEVPFKCHGSHGWWAEEYKNETN